MKQKNAWSWVPSLYFIEGLPYVAIMTLSVIMYKNMGLGNTEIAFYTGWLYLPWVIKPLWSPVIDMLKSKRWWIVATQLLMGAGFAGIALTLPTSHFVQLSIALFWLLAFSSATHDIAADGFYMLGLTQEKQSLFVGIRSTFYRVATIFGQGVLVMAAGYLTQLCGSVARAWMYTFLLTAALLFAAGLYHRHALPRPTDDGQKPHDDGAKRKSGTALFGSIVAGFFKKEQAGRALAFMLLFRLAEAQLVKIVGPFMLEERENGGLELSTTQVGFAYGTIGVIGLVAGGIVGGIAVSRQGLRHWLWPMVCAISLPNLLYVYLSVCQPQEFAIVNACIFVEQAGYGFGFTAYMLYLIYYARGENQTAHYAIATAFMALGMMLPGMVSGWLQELMGYPLFFVWACLCSAATFYVAAHIKIEAGFGKRAAESQ